MIARCTELRVVIPLWAQAACRSVHTEAVHTRAYSTFQQRICSRFSRNIGSSIGLQILQFCQVCHPSMVTSDQEREDSKSMARPQLALAGHQQEPMWSGEALEGSGQEGLQLS